MPNAIDVPSKGKGSANMDSETLAQLIDFAIQNEVDAAGLYEKYGATVSSPDQKELLRELALTEKGHEAKLRSFKATGRLDAGHGSKRQDMKIADFMIDVKIDGNSSLQDVFVFAMKAEEAAARLYGRLAESLGDPAAKELFASLASQEKKHKYDLETEYEKTFMSEN